MNRSVAVIMLMSVKMYGWFLHSYAKTKGFSSVELQS